MISELIFNTCTSEKTCNNYITDGELEVTYKEMPMVFDTIDKFFEDSATPNDSFIAYCCSNNTLGAIFLLWALIKNRKILLLPPRDPKGKYKIDEIQAPDFCQHIISIELKSEGADLQSPATFLQIDINPHYDEGCAFSSTDALVCLKTSGSMSTPKIVIHSADNVAGNVMQCVSRFMLTAEDRVTIPVPIFHMYGFGAGFLPSIIAGAAIDIQDKTNVIKFMDRERIFQPNKAFLTPGLCEMFILTRKGDRQYQLVVTAGDRISQNNFMKFENGFGKLINLYGSTEFGAVATSDPEHPLDKRAQGFLKPLDGINTKIVQTSSSMPSDDESGEIHLSYKYSFLGYFDEKGNPVNGEREINDWFPTRDIAVQAPDNYFKIIGRCDNSVNRDGLLLPLAEIETAMERINGLNRVIAVPHGESKRGKGIVAFCVPEKSGAIQSEDVRQQCFAILPTYAIPDKIFIQKALPRLPNGKIDIQGLINNVIPQE